FTNTDVPFCATPRGGSMNVLSARYVVRRRPWGRGSGGRSEGGPLTRSVGRGGSGVDDAPDRLLERYERTFVSTDRGQHRHPLRIGHHRVHELAVAGVVIELEAHCKRAAGVSAADRAHEADIPRPAAFEHGLRFAVVLQERRVGTWLQGQSRSGYHSHGFAPFARSGWRASRPCPPPEWASVL